MTSLRILASTGNHRVTWKTPPKGSAEMTVRDSYIDEDGQTLTATSVQCGIVELLPLTYLDPDQLADIRSQVEEYNTDPEKAWAALLGTLAENRMWAFTNVLVDSTDVVTLAADRLPERTFHYLELSLDWAEEIARGLSAGGPLRMTQHPGAHGVHIHVATEGEFPFGALSLFNGPVDADQVDDIAREVELYNADPDAALRAIAHDAYTADYQSRAHEIATLALRQREAVRMLDNLA